MSPLKIDANAAEHLARALEHARDAHDHATDADAYDLPEAVRAPLETAVDQLAAAVRLIEDAAQRGGA